MAKCFDQQYASFFKKNHVNSHSTAIESTQTLLTYIL